MESPHRLSDSTLDLTIFIPCLNEEANIVKTLDAVTSAMEELPFRYEVLVTDDGSTDRTVELVRRYIDKHPKLPILLNRNPRNRGLTRSYVDGAFLAHGMFYRMVSGDDPEPKEALIQVFRQIGKADMIIPYHETITGKPARRLMISRFYTWLVNTLSGYRIRYYNGGTVHLRYNVMRWGPYSFGFGFQAELITRLLDEGASYVEVPISVTHREKGKGNSALNLKNFLSVTHTLSEVLIRRIRKRAFRK